MILRRAYNRLRDIFRAHPPGLYGPMPEPRMGTTWDGTGPGLVDVAQESHPVDGVSRWWSATQQRWMYAEDANHQHEALRHDHDMRAAWLRERDRRARQQDPHEARHGPFDPRTMRYADGMTRVEAMVNDVQWRTLESDWRRAVVTIRMDQMDAHQQHYPEEET